jgi:hypothetical protein
MRLLRTKCARYMLLVWFVCSALDATAQQRPTRESDPAVLLGFAALAKYAMLASLTACQSSECQIFRGLGEAFSVKQHSDLGKSLLFVDEYQTFRVAEPKQTAGSPTASLRSRLFISEPISVWDGDLLVVASGSRPQRTSIFRVSGLYLRGTPSIAVYYDSFDNTSLLGPSSDPIGNIGVIDSVGDGTLTLREVLIVGSPNKSARALTLRLSSKGLSMKE